MPNGFTVTVENHGSRELVVLRDNGTGATAHIWTEYGNNCVSLVLPGPRGKPIALIDDLSLLEDLSRFPSRYGTPILYPWPGAIPLGQYLFDGNRYQAQHLDINNNSYHGFAKNRPWRVEGSQATDEFAELRCSISSEENTDTHQTFPFPNVLTVTHRLDATGLTMTAEVFNPGDGPLPFGIGFHPYFKIPFGLGGHRSRCTVDIEANNQWDFEAISKVNASLSHSQSDISGVMKANAFSKAIPLKDTNFNEGFTGLKVNEGQIEARVIDPSSQLAGVMQASDDFKTLVFYTPQTRPAVCLEPWTCTSNAFNLAAQGQDESGVIVLGPGERWRGWMKMSLAAT